MTAWRRLIVSAALTGMLAVATSAVAQVVVAGTIGTPETDISPEQEQLLLREYWAIAKRYMSGEAPRAIKEMGAWTMDRVGKVQMIQFQPEERLSVTRESYAEWNSKTLRSAAMLHSDIALAAFTARNTNAFEFHTGIADGWMTLADDRRSVPNSFRSRWNVAVARLLLSSGDVALAERHLVRIVERIPGDAGILLALGTVRETQGTRVRAAWAEGRPQDPAAATPGRSALLDQAASLFERALAIDPALTEARLRLAHVLLLKGDRAGAEKLLTELLAASSSPASLRYLALLFHGRLLEQKADVNGAAKRYVEAAQAVPGGQSAFLALAHVMHAVGQRDDAATVLERLFDRGSGGADPWWLYPLGLDINVNERFDGLRKEIR